MNRHARWAFALALLPVAACSSNNSAPMQAVTPPPPALAAADMQFVNFAAAMDANEIGSGQLAATKARNARVKRYAAMVVSDHQGVDQKLMTLAQSKGVTPDASEPQMVQDMMTKLQADKPATFDRDYLHDEVADHTMAIKMYQDEIANGQDADVKAFAQQTLPALQAHLKAARALGGR